LYRHSGIDRRSLGRYYPYPLPLFVFSLFLSDFPTSFEGIPRDKYSFYHIVSLYVIKQVGAWVIRLLGGGLGKALIVIIYTSGESYGEALLPGCIF
jgi:hypothetical protein